MIDVVFQAPIAPRGRHDGAAIIGGHAAVFTDAASKKWQAQLTAIAAQYAPVDIIQCPVRVDILAVLPRPQKYMTRTYPAGLMWCPQKPDGDNIRKNVQDAMRSWWRDDKQVVCGETAKCFAEKTGLPRTRVRVRSLENISVEDIVRPLFGFDSKDRAFAQAPMSTGTHPQGDMFPGYPDRVSGIPPHQTEWNAHVADALTGQDGEQSDDFDALENGEIND